MEGLYIVPSWFSGYDVALDLFFATITFLVAFYALKIYYLSNHRESKLFGYAFLSISLSYIARATVNSFVLTTVAEYTPDIPIASVRLAALLGVYAHAFLFMTGLVTITYMTLKIESFKIYSLLWLATIPALMFGSDKSVLAYIYSSIFLLYILGYYITEYKKSHNSRILILVISFGFLLIGSFDFIFSTKSHVYYVTGHIAELIAYLMILYSLLTIVRYGQKKKQT